MESRGRNVLRAAQSEASPKEGRREAKNEKRMTLLEWRYRNGLDLWTGEPLRGLDRTNWERGQRKGLPELEEPDADARRTRLMLELVSGDINIATILAKA